MLPTIDVPQDALFDLCRQWHIRKLAVFGSALRQDFNDASDVDILVAFDDQKTPGFFALHDLEQSLSNLFRGRAIDLVTYKALNQRLKEDVLNSAVVLYER